MGKTVEREKGKTGAAFPVTDKLVGAPIRHRLQTLRQISTHSRNLHWE